MSVRKCGRGGDAWRVLGEPWTLNGVTCHGHRSISHVLCNGNLELEEYTKLEQLEQKGEKKNEKPRSHRTICNLLHVHSFLQKGSSPCTALKHCFTAFFSEGLSKNSGQCEQHVSG